MFLHNKELKGRAREEAAWAKDTGNFQLGLKMRKGANKGRHAKSLSSIPELPTPKPALNIAKKHQAINFHRAGKPKEVQAGPGTTTNPTKKEVKAGTNHQGYVVGKPFKNNRRLKTKEENKNQEQIQQNQKTPKNDGLYPTKTLQGESNPWTLTVAKRG